MSTFCGIDGSIDLSCTKQKLATGGLTQNVYLFNYGQLSQSVSPFPIDGDGYVTSIELDEAYYGLHKFTVIRNSATYTSGANTTDSGNGVFNHSVTFTIQDVSPADKAVIEDMAYSTLGVIVETSSGQFLVFGGTLGMSLESAEKSSGSTPSEATGRVITLSGEQSAMEKVFFRTDYDTSKAYLESLTV